METGNTDMTKQDLIDLAIEYSLITSTSAFHQLSEKAQAAAADHVRKHTRSAR
jgi:hypothetical protein